MPDTTLKLKIKIEGDGSLKEVEMSAEELAKAFVSVKDKVHELNEKLLNANQAAQLFDQVSNAVSNLQSAMHVLTNTYAVQASAEARLEQMMRNTMDATDDEIQSIKILAAEQQKLGIIGDEVILSGAQELATYMQKKDSLEALIPVMNDMIAQQYGYNASAESAVSVAQMMGKVFAGETGALKRLGYTFDEAQEQILKFGTEEEKVATLTEVVGQIVNGTNAKLAATPYGKIVQLSNAFGDLKERIGSIIAPAMNVVDWTARISIATAGIGKGVSTIKGLVVTYKKLTSSLQTATAAQRALSIAAKATVFGLVASAVAALVAIIARLARANKEASETTKELTDSERAYIDAAGDAKAAMISEADELAMLMATHSDTKDSISKLNEKYGEAFGYYNTAAQWYDVLKNKSEAYCRQLGYEAKAKQLSGDIGVKITEKDQKQEKLDELKNQLPDYYNLQLNAAQNANPLTIDGEEVHPRVFVHVELTPEQQVIDQQARELQGEVTALGDEINGLLDQLSETQGKIAQAAADMSAAVNDGTEAVSWQKMGYVDLGKAIEEQEKKWKGLIGIDNEAAKAEKAICDAMRLRYDEMGKAFGLAKENVKEFNDEVRRTPVDLIPELQSISPTSVERSPMPTTEAGFDKWIAALQTNLKNATADMRPAIEVEIANAKKLRDEFLGVKDAVEEVNQTVSASPIDTFTKGWGDIKGVSSSIRSIRDALTETDNAWDALTQTVDGFISLFQSFTSIIEIIKNITTVTKALTEEKKKEAIANTAEAATGAASSVASTPVVGAILAIGAAAAIFAALSKFTKFANGGLVYGPTLGLMGEYAGASSNPEVIAPLSKLQGLLGGQQGRSEVEFHIKGRELVGILNKQNNIYQRNG